MSLLCSKLAGMHPLNEELPKPRFRTFAPGFVNRIKGIDCLRHLYLFLSLKEQAQTILNRRDNMARRSVVQEVNLKCVPIDDDKFQSLLKRTPRIQTLTLCGSPNLTKEGFNHLEKVALKSLTLLKHENGGYRTIRFFIELTHLSLENTRTDETFFRELKKDKLTSLFISGISLKQFHEFKKLPRLESLTIQDCDIDHVLLEKITQLATLRFLTLVNNIGYPAGHLAQLSALTNLQLLDLRAAKINQADFNSFIQLPKLESFDCGHSPEINDDYLTNIPANSLLEVLRLEGCSVTQKGLCHLEKLAHLQVLSLACCLHIDDKSLLTIAQLPYLQSLNLSGCRSIQNFIPHDLANFPHLESLILSSTGLTNAGLENIASLPKLRDLNIQGCLYIQKKGLDAFRRIRRERKLPEVKIFIQCIGSCCNKAPPSLPSQPIFHDLGDQKQPR